MREQGIGPPGPSGAPDPTLPVAAAGPPPAVRILEALRDALRARGGVVVGFSGGVDSAVLAVAAHDALGGHAVAVTVDSPSLPRRELAEAEALARGAGLRWMAVPAHEMENPLYVANRGDRCYFCREEMSAALRRVAAREGIATIAMGVQRDDFGEHRPGHQAMEEAGVWFPLAELGAGKAEVRAMARLLGLPEGIAAKPAMACLSSRLPVGVPVSLLALRRVETAEAWLRDRGFAQVRVRVQPTPQGDAARIEVAPEDVPRVAALARDADAALRAVGFVAVTLDLAGYHRGGAAPGPDAHRAAATPAAPPR